VNGARTANLQLRTFQANLAQLAEHRAQLVAMSPATPDHSLSMAETNDLEFVVLSDVGAQVINRAAAAFPESSSSWSGQKRCARISAFRRRTRKRSARSVPVSMVRR